LDITIYLKLFEFWLQNYKIFSILQIFS
jgi:hypothetical protein